MFEKGKRYLVKPSIQLCRLVDDLAPRANGKIDEVFILAVSPSGKYVRLEFTDDTVAWTESRGWLKLEELNHADIR